MRGWIFSIVGKTRSGLTLPVKSQTIDPGEKVAQGVFVKIADHVSLVEAESIYAEPTERADGALGSTGDQ